MTLGESIATYIQTNLVGDYRPTVIDENTPLIEQGIIDSMGLMQIVLLLEEQTGIRVPDDEVVPDNFETVASIVAMVQRLQANRAGTHGLSSG